MIPNFDDIQCIKANNLAEKNRPSSESTSSVFEKASDTKSKFFVNTKFHFENNSWTWVQGGQIGSNEWLIIQDTNEIYPFIPIQVRKYDHKYVTEINQMSAENHKPL